MDFTFSKPTFKSTRTRLAASLMVFILTFLTGDAFAQNPAWIWSMQDGLSGGGSAEECFFRKKFTLIRPEKAELYFVAGDEFEIFINGQLASRGQSYGQPFQVDVSGLLQPGVNLVAARVRHNTGPKSGIAIKLRIKERGEARWRSLRTDASWKTRLDEVVDWKKNSYNDIGWLNSEVSGEAVEMSGPHTVAALGQTQQAIRQPIAIESAPSQGTTLAKSENSAPAPPTKKDDQARPVAEPRFEIDPEFEVEAVFGPEETDSIIALEINEFGKFLLAREGGPLLIGDPSRPVSDGKRVRIYCNQVQNCQGILSLNGSVFVTGQGPEGLGLYRLDDTNRDGVANSVSRIVEFEGELGEHGPHGLQLGPDGMIYFILGNDCQLTAEVAASSPYQYWYEGDLVPRFEDPGGHASGVTAPGGTIHRVSLDGSKLERVAGGIRNAYDLVFDDRGELFIHDSDMEADEGMTWYRPTSVFHVPDGAELGWRSGWAKFSRHLIDQTPAICETGRGSPTGAVLYQHVQFPVRYQNTIFLADWSEGRILAVRKKRTGAGFTCQTEEFLKGQPLNVCDLAVGQDGAMYFCTGGRGTQGGVYRIGWTGIVPEQVLNFENDLAKIIRHPQPGSAWARQNIATLRNRLGDQWDSSLEGVALEVRNPTKFRVRAMQLMVLYGPVPTDNCLAKLAKDDNAEVRAQAARLCGLRGDATAKSLLKQLVQDSDALVRRCACESCLRLELELPVDALTPMLQSIDRFESLAARRMLERIDAKKWEDSIIESTDRRVFLQGALALMTSQPTLERSYRVLAKSSSLMEGFMNDVDFVDLLRVMQVALVQGNVDPQKLTGLADRIGNEFPSGSDLINQELVKLMGFLKVGNLDGRIAEYLQSTAVPTSVRVHAAMYLQASAANLTDDEKLAVIECLESARTEESTGGSYELYLRQAVRQVCQELSPAQINTILQHGERWPNAVLAAFYKLPVQLDDNLIQRLKDLDRAVQDQNDNASRQLRLGVIALLARSGQEEPMEYLRQLWQQEEDRRNDIVIGLSQQPEGENWAYLVSSLPILDDLTGRQVVQKLAAIGRRPRDPKHFRDVILLGYRLRRNGVDDVVGLLEHWSGVQLENETENWKLRLDNWSEWFKQNWPEEQAINYETPSNNGRYSVNQVLEFIENNGLGNGQRGQHLFVTAQCAQCHQMGAVGQNIGPDLRSVAKRFSVREILEATIEPSKHVPDRYASKVILTTDGQQFNGMAMEQADGGYLLLQSDGQRIRIAASEVEEVRDSEVSAMPDQLLDDLSLSQINDLVAFLVKRDNDLAKRDEPEDSPVR